MHRRQNLTVSWMMKSPIARVVAFLPRRLLSTRSGSPQCAQTLTSALKWTVTGVGKSSAALRPSTIRSMIPRSRVMIPYSVFFYPVPVEQRGNRLGLHRVALAL